MKSYSELSNERYLAFPSYGTVGHAVHLVIVILLSTSLNPIAILTVTSLIVINVPTSDLLAVETKVILFCGFAKFKYQKNCL